MGTQGGGPILLTENDSVQEEELFSVSQTETELLDRVAARIEH